MNEAEFKQFAKTVISEEVTATDPCGCCGIVTFDGVDTAVDRIAREVATWDAFTAEREQCGRCGTYVPANMIQQTGPYRACPMCTAIIRNG